ncbi:MAG: response regulator transcription factor [Chloroflexota bacterium]|nr:response regulator transcription factor [Chloroflexota bacterium]
MTLRLLIAEDERDVADVVAFGTRMNWPDCEIVIAADGNEAVRLFDESNFDLVILDLSMPPPNGFEVCQHIREVSQVPILVLTARHATVDKIRALDLGADDYLTKPFDHLELLARLRALMRRGGSGSSTSTPDQVVGDLAINTQTREVTMRGTTLQLTSTEYRLLEELVRHAGTVLPHSYLLERVWGAEYSGEEQYLKVFVRRLRRKLGDTADQPRYIQTEWGVGYRFIPAP